MNAKNIVLSSLLFISGHAMAAITSTPAEENAIKVVKAAYRFGSVIEELAQLKQLSQVSIDLDSLIKTVDKSQKYLAASVPYILDEVKAGEASDVAVHTIDSVANGLKKIEAEAETELSASNKSSIQGIYSLQKELGGGKAPEEKGSKFDPIYKEASQTLAEVQTYIADVSGDKAKAAAVVLKDVEKDLKTSKDYFDLYTKGEDVDFNLAFGCSALGDVSTDLASADLALGNPANKVKAWRDAIDGIAALVKKTRTVASCQ